MQIAGEPFPVTMSEDRARTSSPHAREQYYQWSRRYLSLTYLDTLIESTSETDPFIPMESYYSKKELSCMAASQR